MIIRKAISQNDLFECVLLRTHVFHIEQAIDVIYAFDDDDKSCLHYIAFDDKKAIGSCRAVIKNEKVKLGRFCVLKDYRKKQVGKAIMTFVEEDLLKQNLHEIYLDAQESAIGFYERLGFIQEGDLFEEAGIMHAKMVKTL